MAVATQLACMDLSSTQRIWKPLTSVLDRTSKSIGLLHAAPIYESVPEFPKYVSIRNYMIEIGY